ncbi:MAG: DUF4153 domain-containing protein [Candidatus Gracilibacteria bacterium]
MKNILSIFSTKALKINLKNIINRFPLSVIIIFIVSTLFFVNLHGNLSRDTSEFVLELIFSFSIIFFFSIGVYLSGENNNFSRLKRNLFQIIPISFGILLFSVFSNNFNDFENILFILLSSAGILFYLFFAPYIKNIFSNNVKQNIFYTYFYNISVLFLMSFILGGILFALGAIGITAVFELFDIRDLFTDDIYGDWAILSLSFITPIFALIQFPSKETFNKNYFNENTFFSFLIKYIAIPFIYIYFIILYAYSIKVLSNFGDWPKGEVSWLVIGFSVFGYIAYIFSFIFEAKNKFIAVFRKTFPYVVIPQIFMLFYAIYLRINQYNITVNRYFVVVFGLWLLTISLYYIFSRKKSLAIIPFLLTIFTIIISIGPWSVHELPESRQLDRLKDNLIKAGILQDNIITPLKDYDDIDKILSRDIYSGIDYLCDFENCNSVKKLFPKIYSEIHKKNKEEFEERKKENLEANKNNTEAIKRIENDNYREPNNWLIVSEITKKIKVMNYYGIFDDTKNQDIYFYKDREMDFFPMDISGYNKILRISSNSNNGYGSNYARINIQKEIIEIILNGEVIETINIQQIINELNKKDITISDNYLSKNDLTFEITSNNKTYKLLFESISIKNPKYTGTYNVNYSSSNGYLLIKN